MTLNTNNSINYKGVLPLSMTYFFSLFTYVNENYLYSRPTYQTFIDLLNNYHHATGTAEHVSPEEQAEEFRFIQEICKTSVMQKTQQFLHKKG